MINEKQQLSIGSCLAMILVKKKKAPLIKQIKFYIR